MTEKQYNVRAGYYHEYTGICRNKEDNLTTNEVCNKLNSLIDENEQLKKENQNYKYLLQDMGLLMSDEEVVNIRNEISDKLLKPLLKGNGFDVDINTDDGFKIIPKGDVE